jgi:hypothetical protein
MERLKIITVVLVLISFMGCSSGRALESSSPSSSSSAQISKVSSESTFSSTYTELLSSNRGINGSGTQVEITGSNTEQVIEANYEDRCRIGFNIENISDKPITGFVIRASSLDGCAVDAGADSESSLAFDQNFQGYQWRYSGKLAPKELAFCDIYVIPKQLKNQKLTFNFYMIDGKTTLKNGNNNPAVAKVRIALKDAPYSSQIEPFDKTDIDIGGKTVQSDSGEKYIVFEINNLSYSNSLDGIMIKTPTKCFPGYDMKGISGGKVTIENNNYVWEFPQKLEVRHGENITIKYPAGGRADYSFDFYTYDGKIQIDTCQIVA